MEVETTYGRIRGEESNGIHSFRGIRYAAAPKGALRFQPPQPPQPWAGVREAVKAGPAAPQFSLPVFSWINLAGASLGDDCLSLNVWTPGLDGARRPVLFWIHGGGFLIGSGSTPVYSGQDIANKGDVVVVTINYRLGALGYTHLNTIFDDEGFKNCSNLGVRDQIAALEWVRDNIAAFGGDPTNVTIFGQSAGGMSVATLLGSPKARDLFHQAICMSGAADHVLSEETAEEVAHAFVKELGGPPPSLEAMGNIPLDTILKAQHEVVNRMANFRDLMIFLPAVDGDIIPRQPLDAIRDGETVDIPIMTGSTLEEWKMFRAIDQGFGRFGWEDLVKRFELVIPTALTSGPPPRQAAEHYRQALEGRSAARKPVDIWSAFQSARVFHHPSNELAEAQAQAGGKVWSYLFTWRPAAMRQSVGSCHAIDIPFVFGSANHPLARPLTGFGGGVAELSEKMRNSWVRFAYDGDPSHEKLPAWSCYDPDSRNTMVLGRSCNLDSGPLEAERLLLRDWKGRSSQSHRSFSEATDPLELLSRATGTL